MNRNSREGEGETNDAGTDEGSTRGRVSLEHCARPATRTRTFQPDEADYAHEAG